MEKEIKQLARKQYIHYFRFWFIALGILAAITGIFWAVRTLATFGAARENDVAPAERVYDYADVLTDEEEENLRNHIAKQEKKYKIDLVLVTINEEIESQGYWDTVMMNKADDFYDQNNYGYNKVHGDGALLLDNWYEDENGSQKGSWLSTCGIVEMRFGYDEIDRVLDVVYKKVEKSPYEAYKAYVDKTCELTVSDGIVIPWLAIFLVSTLVAFIYAAIHLVQRPAKDTAAPNQYVAGGKPQMKGQSDTFMHKNVTKRVISTSSGGSSGGHSGGGGHHRSSGGVSHGGGGRRR